MTLDALHTQKNVTQIIESENHYCIGLKANQPKLLQQAQQCDQLQSPLSHYHTRDTAYGRVVERQVQVLQLLLNWYRSGRV